MGSHSSQSAAVILDIALGVTEACANVVRHAYPDGGGEVELEAVLEDGDLVVCVSDAGVGFEHPPREPGAGLGVPLVERWRRPRFTPGPEVRAFSSASRGPCRRIRARLTDAGHRF